MKVVYLSSFAGSNMSNKSFIEIGPKNVTLEIVGKIIVVTPAPECAVQ